MQQLTNYGNLLRGGQGAMGTVGTSTTPQGSIGAQLAGGVMALGGIYGQNQKGIDSAISHGWNWLTGGSPT